MQEDVEEESPLSRAERSFFGPLAYNIAVLAMNAGYVVAFLAAAYLLYGLFSGNLAQFHTLNHEDQLRVLANIGAATKTLTYSLGIASLATAYVLWGEDFVGYAMLVVALLVGIGIPQGFTMLGGDKDSGQATALSLRAFAAAMMAPLVISGVLVARDIVLRLVNGVRNRPVRVEKMTYGRGAKEESRPIRTSLFAKCWEGPYCREFIRTSCPIFISRKACWREKRGCYCEEDIVSAAAAKVNGIHLDMAPDPKMNFANSPTPASAPTHTVAFDPLAPGSTQMQSIGGGSMGTMGSMGSLESGIGAGVGGGYSLTPTPPRKIELSPGQKRERCRNCVIYNEHQREKYKLLMPVALLGTIVVCGILSTHLRELIGTGLSTVDKVLNRASFLPGSESTVHFAQPPASVEWLLLAALTLMLVSKVLQLLEWAVFKIKV